MVWQKERHLEGVPEKGLQEEGLQEGEHPEGLQEGRKLQEEREDKLLTRIYRLIILNL